MLILVCLKSAFFFFAAVYFLVIDDKYKIDGLHLGIVCLFIATALIHIAACISNQRKRIVEIENKLDKLEKSGDT